MSTSSLLMRYRSKSKGPSKTSNFTLYSGISYRRVQARRDEDVRRGIGRLQRRSTRQKGFGSSRVSERLKTRTSTLRLITKEAAGFLNGFLDRRRPWRALTGFRHLIFGSWS